MKRYRTERYNNEIKEAEVVRETKASVFFADGAREFKVTQYHLWWDSREEALAYLIKRTEGQLEIMRCSMEKLTNELAELKGED